MRCWWPAAFIVRPPCGKSGGTPSGLTVYAAVARQSHHQTVADLLPQPEPAPRSATSSPKEKMAHRLQTSVGQQLYKLRKQTVEPVFGIIKSVLGFRQFLLRGREKVSLEWLLVCVSYNFKRLFTLKKSGPSGIKTKASVRREAKPRNPAAPKPPNRASNQRPKGFSDNLRGSPLLASQKIISKSQFQNLRWFMAAGELGGG